MADFVVPGGAVSPALKEAPETLRPLDNPKVRRPVWVVPEEVPAIVPRSTWRTEPDWVRKYRWAAITADFAAALIGVTLALLTRFGDEVGLGYLIFGAIIPFGWLAAMALSRGYDSRLFGSGTDDFRAVVRGGLGLGVAIAIASYVSHSNVARGFVVVAMPAIILLTLTMRWLQRRELARQRLAGRCMRRVLVVGRNGQAATIADHLEHESSEGYVVVANCVPRAEQIIDSEDPSDLAETDIMAAVHTHRVDVVAVAADPELAGQTLRRLTWALEQQGVDLIVSPGIVEVAGPRISIRPVAGLSLLHVERPSVSAGPRLLKSVFDRIVALLLILLLAPLMLATAITVRLTSRGPVIFRQRRVGLGGQEFSMLKFRTMSEDAEALRPTVEDRSDGNGVLFKLRDDPRVTRLGRTLRRFSLDELPQLFNVLRGEMSVVGPRPPLPEEVAGYAPDDNRRMIMKPGMTGLWQVSGRSDLSWEETIRLDLRYVDNWSMTLDLLILWKTAHAVFSRNGAY